MDALLAIETWIAAAQVSSTGASISGADAAQGSASGRMDVRALEYLELHTPAIGFRHPQMSYVTKRGTILRSRFGALKTRWNRKRARKMVAVF